MAGDNSFTKQERLSGKKLMDELFRDGESFTVYPFRVVYMVADQLTEGSPARVGISVPKKRIKTAVERNLIKRRIREAYRLNKGKLYDTLINEKKTLIFMLLYLHGAKKGYAEVEEKINLILGRLSRALSEEKQNEKT